MSIDLRDSSAVGDDDEEEHGLDRQTITDSFISAIESLDVGKVEMLLKSDFEIDYPNSGHHSVLHSAMRLINAGANRWEYGLNIFNKHLNPLNRSETFLRIVQGLLESGRFNVNSLVYSSNTTLHSAVQYCSCRNSHCDEYKAMVNAIIELLLKNNANINAKNSDGETPLMIASEKGCSHVVQLLLDWRDEQGAGVELNARDIRGETPLMKASEQECSHVVQLLLDWRDEQGAGVDFDARNIYGETALMKASEEGCSHIVQLLLKWGDEHDAEVDFNARDMYGETALNKAATRVHVKVVELLLQHGCMALCRLDRQAITDSVVLAIKYLDVDKLKMLLKSDFEIDNPNIDPLVLHTAVVLIATGANSWKDGRTLDIHSKHLNLLNRSKTFLRIVQGLLESGRFNVNSLDYSSKTALHFAVEYCRCRNSPCDEYEAMVNATIEVLLKNNANINAKTSDGETPLMIASEKGCSHIVKLLLDWRDEFGARVELNARNIRGETALIKAAKWLQVDVVELLLQRGCLDEFHDHRGFYALHAVICGHDLMDDVSSDFLGSIGIDVSEKTLALLNGHDKNGLREKISKNLSKNDDIQKIVRMLVISGRAEVNSKDFRGNTVFDLAVKSKLRISQETIEMITKCDGCFCVSANRHPENSENTFQNADNFGKTPLHRLSTVLSDLYDWKKAEVFDSLYLLNSSPYKDLFEAMAVAKDHRGRTTLHYTVLPSFFPSSDRVLLENILRSTRIINERDNYGRTPLHYCQDMDVYESLVEQGAEEHIKDIDGKTPQDFKELRCEENNRRDLPLEATRVLDYCFDDDDDCEERAGDNSNLEDQLNMRKLDARMIWKDSSYAYRDHFLTTMCDKVRQFMDRLSDEIGKKDPRFECLPVLVGSAVEGTKLGLPDEFDFNFVLIKLSELCEVVPSPETPSGYVHLKRISYNGERCHSNQGFNDEENFDRFFNNDGFLLTTEIASRFRILYLQIVSESEFWDGEDVFEWETCNEIGLFYLKEEQEFDGSEVENDLRPSTHPCSNIRLKLNRPINGRYMFTDISLDIVPCIRINDFWPGESLSSLSDEIKCEGCYLVFDQPQRKYPWVPVSDPFARISFAPAENRLIKECSAVARAAYMVGKHLLHYRPQLTYVLKNCLFYCIEALKDCTDNSLLYEDIDATELRFFVEKLMLCFREFYRKDFLPCYMMPSFHLPIEGYLKSNHDKHRNDSSSFLHTLFAYKLYKSVCTTESEVDVCIPTPQPLNEHFNREELLRKLSLGNRSSVEHRRVQPARLAKELKIRSDSKGDLQVRSKTSRKRRKQMIENITKVKRKDLAETN